MNDSTYTLLLVGACGLGLLCLVSLGIGLAVMSGVMGGGGLRLFGRSVSRAPQPSATRRERPDLRAQAASADFDAALARYSDPTAPPGPPLAAPPDQGPLLIDRPPARRPARPDDGYSDDEVFGGILDETGDGYPDL